MQTPIFTVKISFVKYCSMYCPGIFRSTNMEKKKPLHIQYVSQMCRTKEMNSSFSSGVILLCLKLAVYFEFAEKNCDIIHLEQTYCCNISFLLLLYYILNLQQNKSKAEKIQDRYILCCFLNNNLYQFIHQYSFQQHGKI